MNDIFALRFSTLRFVAAPLFSMALLFGLVACGEKSRPIDKLAQDTSSSVQDFDNNLTFNDVTLEQADEQGRPFWKVKAKQAKYSKDKKVAQVQSPTGELFQDGKAVYQISAQQGEIQQDGKKLFLKGKIVATDPRNGLVLRGNELEWQPTKDLLIVTNQVTGNHKQVQAVAQAARVNSRQQRVELQKQVVAVTTDPVMQIRTEHLIWQIPQQKFIGDRPIQIDRYKNKNITDRATANQGGFDLKTKIATLKQNAQIALFAPPMQITSNSMTWNLNAEIVTADQPVRVVHRQRQITVTAKQGRMDLQKEIVYMTGDVYGIGQRRQSLNAKTMVWYLKSQLVEAQGNVAYSQVEPPMNFTGQKAVGQLEDQNITVSGGRVVTEIIP